jgi:ABC-type uncharacterized transport system permease subunit
MYTTGTCIGPRPEKQALGDFRPFFGGNQLQLDHFIANLSLFAFAFASLGYLRALIKGRRVQAQGSVPIPVLVLGLATVCSAFIAVRGVVQGFDRSTSPMVLASWIGIITVFSHFRYRAYNMGALTAPLATLILFLRSFAWNSPTTLSPAPDYLVAIHVSLALAGEAFAIVACAVSCMFLWQQRALKKKHLGQLRSGFPALDRLQQVLEMSMWIGLICLTLGLVSGALVKQYYSATSGLELKVVWALIVWAWYLITILCSNLFQWPVRRMAQMSLTGFALLSIMLFGLSSLGAP